MLFAGFETLVNVGSDQQISSGFLPSHCSSPVPSFHFGVLSVSVVKMFLIYDGKASVSEQNKSISLWGAVP